MNRCRNPLHCILPPSVLESIAVNGDEEQRSWAVSALGHDHSIRLARVENAKSRAGGPRERGGMRSPSALPRSQTGSSAMRPAPRTSTPRSFAARGTRRPRRRPSTRPTRDWVTLSRSSARPSTATRSMTPGCRCEGWSIGDRYPNAFWDGRRMVFGDGDGEIFKRLNDLDVNAEGRVHAISSLSRCLYQLSRGPRTRSSRRNRGGGCRNRSSRATIESPGAGLRW